MRRGLPGSMADARAGGWTDVLDRLAAAAERSEVGPDPFAGPTERPRARHVTPFADWTTCEATAAARMST